MKKSLAWLLTLCVLGFVVSPARADEPTLIVAMNRQIQGTLQHVKDERAAEIKRRRTINALSALAFFAEGFRDCDQSRQIISAGGRENNRATPAFVVAQFKRNSGKACKIGFGLAAMGGYALGNRLDPTPGVIIDVVELVNIASNQAFLHGK